MEKLTKDQVQADALLAWNNSNCVGMICGATGVGKSRIGLLAAQLAFEEDGPCTDIILVAPYLELLNKNWPEEFEKWGLGELWQYVTPVTYVSFHKLEKKPRSLILLDEVHHLTKNAGKFFENNPQTKIMGLTATPPRKDQYTTDDSNTSVIDRIMPTVYSISLDKAVENALVADYRIYVVDCFLDATDKYIPSGTKNNPFMTSEMTAYMYFNKSIRRAMGMGKPGFVQAITNKRMHFIYNLRSKLIVAQKILAKIPETERTIVFCGSIAQAETLMGEHVFHSKSGNQALEDFKSGKINRLGVVKKLDEGHNLENIDSELIVQASSVDRSTIQRLGRSIRFRENHKARVFVLATQNTVDTKWVDSALDGFDKTKVSHYSSLKL